MLEESWIASLPCGKQASIDIDIDNTEVKDEVLSEIDSLVTKGYTCGSHELKCGESYNWILVDVETDLVNMYLSKKEEILKEKGAVVFEHNQNIYEVFKRCDGDFEYNIYSLRDFVSGDTLETIDGGIVEGDEREAIYSAIN